MTKETYKDSLDFLKLLLPLVEKYKVVISDESDDPFTKYCEEFNDTCQYCIFTQICNEACNPKTEYGVKKFIEILEKECFEEQKRKNALRIEATE